ncbi:hypothetical protein C2S52_000622, partial [Perilla frutescens var. hirtella]
EPPCDLICNVLERSFKESQRGLESSKFRIIAKTDDKIKVSFIKTWNVSLDKNVIPLYIDKRYIMLRGVSGFYSYAIYEHLEKWPDLNIDETRITIKMDQNMVGTQVLKFESIYLSCIDSGKLIVQDFPHGLEGELWMNLDGDIAPVCLNILPLVSLLFRSFGRGCWVCELNVFEVGFEGFFPLDWNWAFSMPSNLLRITATGFSLCCALLEGGFLHVPAGA